MKTGTLGGPVMAEVRLTAGDGDQWGWVMGWWFGIAEALWRSHATVPEEWEYSPSPLLPKVLPTTEKQWADLDYETHVLLTGLKEGRWTIEQVLRAGLVLTRYARQLQLAGLNY